MKLSAGAPTSDGEMIIATYNSGNLQLSRADASGANLLLGSIHSCDELEAICIATVALLIKLKERGFALSNNGRVEELQHDLRKLTLKSISKDAEGNVVSDVDF